MSDRITKYQLALDEIKKLGGNIKDPQMGEIYEIFSDVEKDGRTMFSLYASPSETGMKYTWGRADRWGHNPAFSISGNKRNAAKQLLEKTEGEGITEQEAARLLYEYREKTDPESTMDKVMKYLGEIF